MIFASSDYTADRLGEFLVRNGKMTRTHLDLASQKVKETGLRLGAIMVTMGLMTESEMLARVDEQLRAIIYSLFMWDRGEYSFMPKQTPVATELAMDLPTFSIILEGIRRIHEPAVLLRALGSFDRVVNFTKDPSTLPEAISLRPEESYVLSRVDGQSSIADIVNISPVSEADTLRCLYGLLSVGLLELGNKSQELIPSKKSKEIIGPPESHRPPAQEETPTVKSDLSSEEQWIQQDVMSKYSSMGSGTYYDWLEVRRNAKEDEIKKSFHSMIRTYHPDRLYSRNLQDLKGNLEAIISKITNAYQVLSDPVARRRYDNSLRTEAPRGEDLTPRAASAPVPKKADPAETSKKTAQYYYREAKKRFDIGDYHQTAELMDVPLRLDPKNAYYHKLQAKALAKNPNWSKDAEEHYQVALESDPFDVECLVGLGELYEAAGLVRKSERMFFRALGLDPGNKELKEKLGSKKQQLPKWKSWVKTWWH
jgi:Tfp pilus assembly protein PilF